MYKINGRAHKDAIKPNTIVGTLPGIVLSNKNMAKFTQETKTTHAELVEWDLSKYIQQCNIIALISIFQVTRKQQNWNKQIRPHNQVYPVPLTQGQTPLFQFRQVSTMSCSK